MNSRIDQTRRESQFQTAIAQPCDVPPARTCLRDFSKCRFQLVLLVCAWMLWILPTARGQENIAQDCSCEHLHQSWLDARREYVIAKKIYWDAFEAEQKAFQNFQKAAAAPDYKYNRTNPGTADTDLNKTFKDFAAAKAAVEHAAALEEKYYREWKACLEKLRALIKEGKCKETEEVYLAPTLPPAPQANTGTAPAPAQPPTPAPPASPPQSGGSGGQSGGQGSGTPPAPSPAQDAGKKSNANNYPDLLGDIMRLLLGLPPDSPPVEMKIVSPESDLYDNPTEDPDNLEGNPNEPRMSDVQDTISQGPALGSSNGITAYFDPNFPQRGPLVSVTAKGLMTISGQTSDPVVVALNGVVMDNNWWEQQFSCSDCTYDPTGRRVRPSPSLEFWGTDIGLRLQSLWTILPRSSGWLTAGGNASLPGSSWSSLFATYGFSNLARPKPECSPQCDFWYWNWQDLADDLQGGDPNVSPRDVSWAEMWYRTCVNNCSAGQNTGPITETLNTNADYSPSSSPLEATGINPSKPASAKSNLHLGLRYKNMFSDKPGASDTISPQPKVTNTAASGERIVVIQIIIVSGTGNPASARDRMQLRALPPNPDAWRVSSGPRWGERLKPASLHTPGSVLAHAGVTPQAASPNEIWYSFVANGNSSGQALELQVFDPSGNVKEAEVPEGVILEPVKIGSAKPVSETAKGGNLLKKPLDAYCVEFAKLPPEPGMLYRIASENIQEKYKPLRSVLRAGRELAEGGKLHPDSEAQQYFDAIRQYALWSKLENWDMAKFGEMFTERTKKNAQAVNVKWTKQMEQAVRALVPGRWRDISMVLEEAEKLARAADQASAPAAPQKPKQ